MGDVVIAGRRPGPWRWIEPKTQRTSSVVVVHPEGRVPRYAMSRVVVAGRGRHAYVRGHMTLREALYATLSGLHRRTVL